MTDVEDAKTMMTHEAEHRHDDDTQNALSSSIDIDADRQEAHPLKQLNQKETVANNANVNADNSEGPLSAPEPMLPTASQTTSIMANSQYQLMSRPHANPLWVVPRPDQLTQSTDELEDDEGDALIHLGLALARQRFDANMELDVALRMHAIEGRIESKHAHMHPSFLKDIEANRVRVDRKKRARRDVLTQRGSSTRPMTGVSGRASTLKQRPGSTMSNRAPGDMGKDPSAMRPRTAVLKAGHAATGMTPQPPTSPPPHPSLTRGASVPMRRHAPVLHRSQYDITMSDDAAPHASLPSSPYQSFDASTSPRHSERPPSVTFTTPLHRSADSDDTMPFTPHHASILQQMEEKGDEKEGTSARQHSNIPSLNFVAMSRPYTAKTPDRIVTPRPIVSAASTSDARMWRRSGSSTARPYSSRSSIIPSCPQTTMSGFIPRALSTFGYSEREIVDPKSPPPSVLGSMSAAMSRMDVLAQPLTVASPRDMPRPSTGGCAVRYRSSRTSRSGTNRSGDDKLTLEISDTLAMNTTKLMEVQQFRRDVDNMVDRHIDDDDDDMDYGIDNMRRRMIRSDTAVSLSARGASRSGSTSTSMELHRAHANVAGRRGLERARARTSHGGMRPMPITRNPTFNHVPDFGQPSSGPFRPTMTTTADMHFPTGSAHVVAAGGVTVVAAPSHKPQSPAPGSYEPDYDASRPHNPRASPVVYGPNPPEPADLKRDRLKRTDGGPGQYRIKTDAISTSTSSHVSFGKQSSRGEWDYLGPRARSMLLTPPPASYDPWHDSTLWTDALKRSVTEHAFGRTERFHNTPYASIKPHQLHTKHLEPDSAFNIRDPEKLLRVLGPEHGVGVLHPRATGGAREIGARYDPNMEGYLRSMSIPPLAQLTPYLDRAQQTMMINGKVSGDDERGVPLNNKRHDREAAKQKRQFDNMLQHALSLNPAAAVTRPSEPSRPTAVPPNQQGALAHQPEQMSKEQAEVGDDSQLVDEEKKLDDEQSPERESHTNKLEPPVPFPTVASNSGRSVEEKGKDHISMNRRLMGATFTPEARRQARAKQTEANAARRLDAITAAHHILLARHRKLRNKLNHQDALLAVRTGGGLVIHRWLMLVQLYSRTAFFFRAATFLTHIRATREYHNAAARKIQRIWKKHYQHIMNVRRHAALGTLSRAVGFFKVKLRILRKRKAANLLRHFFRNAAALQQGPFSVHVNTPHARTRSEVAETNLLQQELPTYAQQQERQRAKQREQRAMLAKLKLKSGNDRTLIGLIRHFKSQVQILQRAYRRYVLMRDTSVDLHVLLWDSVVADHFTAVYTRMHRQHTAQASTTHPSGSKPPESSKAFKLQKQAIKLYREEREQKEKERKQLEFEEQLLGATIYRDKTPKRAGNAAGNKIVSIEQAVIAATTSPVASPRSTSPPRTSTSTSSSAKSTSPSQPHVHPHSPKLKPVVLQLDVRFSLAEKKTIILEALHVRKRRFIHVYRQYLQDMKRYVDDQKNGVSAARRLLDTRSDCAAPTSHADSSLSSSPSSSSLTFEREYAETHPPPTLPRILTRRQMTLLINLACQARKTARKGKYQTPSQAKVADETAIAGRSIRQLFTSSHQRMDHHAFGSSTSSFTSPFKPPVLHKHEHEWSESRVREPLLRAWAAQLPMPMVKRHIQVGSTSASVGRDDASADKDFRVVDSSSNVDATAAPSHSVFSPASPTRRAPTSFSSTPHSHSALSYSSYGALSMRSGNSMSTGSILEDLIEE